MDEKKAMQMIRETCEWLEQGAPGSVRENSYESLEAAIARYMCDELLKAANADGMGGCPLCQG